jgi:putative transposase
MGRPLRVEVAGGIHHVTVRGNDRQPTYVDDGDRRLLLAVLERTTIQFEWVLLAYCLMSNHAHLLIETPEPNLGAGMQLLNGMYARKFNRRHGRIDHLFRNRYASTLITTEQHLFATCRYIALNPVRAGVVTDPADWPWSSYCATAGIVPAPRFLAVTNVLELFASNPVTARRRYQDFVADGIEHSLHAVAIL